MTPTTHTHHTPVPSITAPGGPALRIRQDDLPGTADARRFIGEQHDGVPMSMFLVDAPPGGGPRLHRHPYPELFILHAGTARFEIDDASLTATAGELLVAPARSAHRFTNVGTGRLQITAIHPASTMTTEWLEPEEPKPTPC